MTLGTSFVFSSTSMDLRTFDIEIWTTTGNGIKNWQR